MRLNALFMVVLVASMSGSIAYTNISTHPDMSKMSNELISELDSSEELEVIIQFTGAVSYTHLTLPTILLV